MAKSLDLPVLSLAIPNIEKINTTDTDNISCLWTVFTKCKDNLEHGKRLENLSWRLWYRERSAAAQSKPPVNPVPIQQVKQEDHFDNHNDNAKHVSSTSFKRLISSFDDKIRLPITRLNSLPNEIPSHQQRNEVDTIPACRAKKFFIRDDDDDDDDECEDIYEENITIYQQQQQQQQQQSEYLNSINDNKITLADINNTEQQQQQNQTTFLPVSSCDRYQSDTIMNNNMYGCTEADHAIQLHDVSAATKSLIDDNKMTHNLIQNTNNNKNNPKGAHHGFKVGKKHQYKRKPLFLPKHQQHVYKWSPSLPLEAAKQIKEEEEEEEEEDEEEEITKKLKLDQCLDFSKQKPTAMVSKGPSLLSNMFNLNRLDRFLLQSVPPQTPPGDELSFSIKECVAWEYRQNNLIYPSIPFTFEDKVMEGTHVW